MLVALGLCFYFMLSDEGITNSVNELEMHCAAGLQKPVEEIARQYEKAYGVKIRLNFGGSGQLLTKLEIAGGDLYLPADKSYTDQAKDQGLVAETLTVSKLTAGIIVAKGNPRNIKSLNDLTQNDVKVVIARRSAAVGKFTHQVLEKAKLLTAIENGIISKVGTVNEVALQVNLGASDAGIVWDALIPQFDQSEFVIVPEFDQQPKYATIGVLENSKNRTEALKFARYLTAKDQGTLVFEKYGFASIVSEVE